MQVSVEDRTVHDESIIWYRLLVVVFIYAFKPDRGSVTVIAAKLVGPDGVLKQNTYRN